MITSKELRIGNILKANTGGTFLIVTEITEENQSFSVIDPTNFPLQRGWEAHSVSLTSELLTEKMGFLSDETGKHWIGDFELYPIGKGFDYEGKVLVTSVHQLQNIYYFNEGSELPVNF